MTALETVLVFAGIPLAVVAVVSLIVYGLGTRRTPRYRPGRSFEFQPVWFLASAPAATNAAAVHTAELDGAPANDRRALPAGSGESAEARRAAAAARRGARRKAAAEGAAPDVAGESGATVNSDDGRAVVAATDSNAARKGGARGTW